MATTKVREESKKIENVIIDTDPGVDDAIALMYALTCEELNIKLLSTAGGNGPIENITANALHLCELFGAQIPVVQGSLAPLKRKAGYALSAQGKGGLGNYSYNKKKLRSHAVEGEACDVIYRTLKEIGGKTSIISIGPMTNLAKMLEKYPDSKKYIKQIIFESGTKEKIYGKPYKSFNVGYDPESAEVVFGSGVKLVMVPMELGHFAYLDKDDIKRFKKTNKIGKIFAKMFKGYSDFHVGKLGAAVHDACAIFYLTHPEYIKTEKAFIEIKYYPQENAVQTQNAKSVDCKTTYDKEKNDLQNDTKLEMNNKNSFDQEKLATDNALNDEKYSTIDNKNLNSNKPCTNNAENFGYVDIDFDRTPNATVCMDININLFKRDLFEALEKYKNQ